MRITYVGTTRNVDQYGQSFNTEYHIAKTLENMGHTVNFIQENEIYPNSLVPMVEGSDLFFFTSTMPDRVTHTDLKSIESMGIATVSIHLDAYALIARDGGLKNKTPFWSTQFVFTPENSVQAQKVFKQYGVNHYYFKPAVFEDECILYDLPLVNDIVFVGTGVEYMHPEWPYRAELVRWLMNTYGYRFRKFGYPQQTVRGLELNKLYASSKIVIGDSLNKDFIDSHYWSDRCYETIGRGGFLIHPYVPGITDSFVDRKEIVLYGYGNFTQLSNLIAYYLNPENAEERESIRRAGFERVKKDHTYTNRVKEIFDVLKKEGAIK